MSASSARTQPQKIGESSVLEGKGRRMLSESCSGILGQRLLPTAQTRMGSVRITSGTPANSPPRPHRPVNQSSTRRPGLRGGGRFGQRGWRPRALLLTPPRIPVYFKPVFGTVPEMIPPRCPANPSRLPTAVGPALGIRTAAGLEGKPLACLPGGVASWGLRVLPFPVRGFL